MHEVIDSINLILRNAPVGGEDDALEIRWWIRSVIVSIIHYKAEHERAKCMGILPTTTMSMLVLSKYLSSENVQHSYGKLRVRGVQIRTDTELFRNHCEVNVNVFLVAGDQSKLAIEGSFARHSKLECRCSCSCSLIQ